MELGAAEKRELAAVAAEAVLFHEAILGLVSAGVGGGDSDPRSVQVLEGMKDIDARLTMVLSQCGIEP